MKGEASKAQAEVVFCKPIFLGSRQLLIHLLIHALSKLVVLKVGLILQATKP